MKNAIKKPLFIVLAIIILTCMALPKPGASATEFLGGDNKLTVEVKYGGNMLGNMEVGIYRVATLTIVSNRKVIYELVPEFDGAVDNWPEEMKVTAERMSEIANALVNHATKDEIERVTGTTDGNGRVVFENLQAGLYLVMQENPRGRSYRFAPSLVPVGLEGAGAEVMVIPKTSWETTRTPTTITPTPTEEPTPTPTTVITITPTQPPGDDIDITPTGPPTTDFPDGDKPDQDIIQTGVFNFDLIIISLAAIGVLLLVIGIIQNRRSQVNNEQPTGNFHQ